jgi:hypothetical protein
VELLVRRPPRLVEVVVDPPERRRPEEGFPDGAIVRLDEQRPFGSREEIVGAGEELRPARAGQPLVGEHQDHILAGRL